jgi:holo-[acyl-carrier protein] synthase
MQVIGHGIDLVEVSRIGEMMGRHPERFLERVFTEGEAAYCCGSAKRRDEHLAARFAAKEAVLKALGTGWSEGIAWTEVEVVRLATGEPTVQLSGRAAERAAAIGVRGWKISISHTGTHAMASVIALG